MKCPNCGKEIANDSVFCEYCGTPIKNAKKSKKNLWITLGVAGVVLIALIVIAGGSGSSDTSYDATSEIISDSLSAQMVGVVEPEYVDLGLPSGTLWKSTNEDAGLYTFNMAMAYYGDNLPSLAQWNELKQCSWQWLADGVRITGPNGNSIFLPKTGYGYCNGNMEESGDACYWTSTIKGKEKAYSFWMNSIQQVFSSCDEHCMWYAVRLVSK